jgi:hypothetical protein
MPIQSRRATEIIECRLTEENPGFVSIVAMLETAWVLERAYRPESAATWDSSFLEPLVWHLKGIRRVCGVCSRRNRRRR